MPKFINVLIVDDQQLMRAGLRTLLELELDIKVVAEASDGKEAIRHYEAFNLDVVLMDIRIPVLDGVSATRALKEAELDVRILVLTTFDDDAYIFDALRAGALGYMLKDVSGDGLSRAVRTVALGNALMSPSIAGKVLGQFSKLIPQNESGSRRLIEPLSDRELDILKGIAMGLSNAEIAKKQKLAEGTIKNYVSIILQKTGTKDRTQAALRAQSLGLL